MFIDIVTGFLEGGKTTLLRQMLLRDTGFEDGKVLLLVCEEGIEEWEEVEELEHVVIQTISEEQLLDGTSMEQWIERYSPSHILMEYNGMWDMERVLGLPLGKDVRIRKDIRIMAPSSKVLYYELLKEGGVERITKQFQLDFVSSIMQVYVSTQWIENRMSSNRLGSYFVAAGAGAFFPICDCGMVPIVSGLLRKNVSFPQTMLLLDEVLLEVSLCFRFWGTLWQGRSWILRI